MARAAVMAELAQDDDDALMRRVAMRDAAAFRCLVDDHVRTVHRIAYRMTGNASDADDITQDALARLWQHAARWQAGGPGVGAWLTRVAVNLCLDRLRKRRFASDDEAPERVDEAPLAHDTIMLAQQRAQVISAIAVLPDRQRAAIVLTYYEDQPNAAAADMLDMNIKAFESLLLRARSALKRVLTDDPGSENGNWADA